MQKLLSNDESTLTLLLNITVPLNVSCTVENRYSPQIGIKTITCMNYVNVAFHTGQKFALMEDKVILTNILRQFAIESVQTVDEAKPAGQLIVRPVDGSLYVKFNSRK